MVFCYGSPSRLRHHLSTIKTAAAPGDRTSIHVEISQEAGLGLGWTPTYNQAGPEYTEQPGRTGPRALEDACLDFCFSLSLLGSLQFPLQRKRLINHSAPLWGSQQGRVTPLRGSKERLNFMAV